MTDYTPPEYQFTGLNYNPEFFQQQSGQSSLDTTTGDIRYLQRTGNPTSIASNTTFTGSITANGSTFTGTNQFTGGSVSAPTVSTTDNSTQVATTAYVKNQGYTTLSAVQSQNYAQLWYANTYLGTNTFSNYIPTINAALSPSANNHLVPKNYVDASVGSVYSSDGVYTGTNSYTMYCPTTSITPVNDFDLVNKQYIDLTIIGSSSRSNTWTSSNTFDTALRTSVSAIANTDVVNKAYADANLSNASLLSGTNTFSGVNTFNNNFVVNCPSSGTILLEYNGTNIIEISEYALYSPLSISPSFSQITFNYAPVFRSSFSLDNNITMNVGSVYGTATLAIFNGELNVSATNGTFKTNTIEPTLTNANIIAFSTSTATLNLGNASANLVNTFANNTYNKITLAGKNLYSVDALRTTSFTISSPFFAVYPVAPTANLVITLPAASATNLGTTFTIRRTGGTTSVTVNSASSNVYPLTSLTAGTSILAGGASAGYRTTLVCSYLTATTYGWFII